ncbi:MAG: TetR/AcrR family transcriptional regulator [Bacillus sp. (in: firmicutes)]
MYNTLFESILEQWAIKKKTKKQLAIAEAAIKLFAEKGYANTSTAEIAKVAEVSEGTIFKHYRTKDHLLLSVILPFIKENFPTLAQEVLKKTLTEQTRTFEEFLKGFLRNRVDFVKANKEIFQVVIKELIYRDDFKNELVSYIAKQAPSILKKVINEFKQRGELIDLPTDEIFNGLFTVLGGFFVTRFVLFNNYDITDEDIDQLVRFIMDGIRKHS